MATSQTILLTGATSGLGLNTVQQLGKIPGVNIIVGARAPEKAHRLRSVVPMERLTILPLDLASLGSVRRFAVAVINHLGTARLSAVGLNAGIQIKTGLKKSEDGYELTFASNHLGHFLLIFLIWPILAENAAVVSTASGTHDPDDPGSRRFGFRGGLFPSAEAVASGKLDTSVQLDQQCLDCYATSKLCNLLFTYDMARRVSADRARFLAFDPGLMPGTALARDRGAMARFTWKTIMPLIGLFMPGVSSPEQSSRALSHLLTDPSIASTTGLHFDYRLKQTKTSDGSQRQDWQRDLYETSVRLSGAEIEIMQDHRLCNQVAPNY